MGPPSARIRCASDVRRTGRRHAFTLIEILFAVAIIALLASMAALRGGSAIAHARLDTARERVIANLTQYRERAVATSTTQKIVFSTTGYQVYEGAVATARESVNLTVDPYMLTSVSANFSTKAQVTFDPYGAASADGTIVLTGPGGTRTIAVVAQTGRVEGR